MRSYFPILTILFLLALTSVRADETVTAVGTLWDKPNIAIVPGEKVTWDWTGIHNSESTTGNNCVQGGSDPWTFTTSGMSHTFNIVNSFNYMCSIHCSLGMKGIVNVIDYTLSSSPSTVTALQGGSGTSTATITSVNSFTLPVTLSTSGLPAGVTSSFSVNPVTPPANGTATSVMTVNVGGAVTPGSYPFTLTATATSNSSTPGVDTKTFDMTLDVVANSDFTINCNPSTWVMTVDGSATNTCTVGSVGGFSDVVTLSCAGNPAGSTCDITPNPVTPPANSSVDTSVTVNAQGAAAAGMYNLQITGTSSSGTHTFNGTVVIEDYTVTASPTSVVAPPGGSTGTTATIASLFGFNNPVTMACTGLPAGATCGFNPTQPTPPPSGTIDSQVTINVSNTVAENTYPFQITGTSGGLTRSQAMSLHVTTAQDFGISCTPSAPSGLRGATAQSTCTITSINSFNSPVTLSCSSLPAGVTCDFAPNPATPPANNTVDSTLTVNIGADVLIGSYPFEVDATDGVSLNHAANLTLNVTPEFEDQFSDGDVSDWTFKKGTWSSPSGVLVGVSTKKSVAVAPYTMPANSTVEADLSTAGGIANQVSLYGWYKDSRNYVELMMKQQSGKWILRQKVNGARIFKTKIILPINTNTMYHALLSYDGTQLHVSIDGTPAVSVNAPAPPPGSPGFKIKATTGTFDNIMAYQ